MHCLQIHFGVDTHAKTFKLEVYEALDKWTFCLVLKMVLSRFLLFNSLTLQVAWYQVRAKNEASFRCPDQDGWQPEHEAIDTNKCIDSYLYTDLPIKAIMGAAHALLAVLSSTLLLHQD